MCPVLHILFYLQWSSVWPCSMQSPFSGRFHPRQQQWPSFPNWPFPHKTPQCLETIKKTKKQIQQIKWSVKRCFFPRCTLSLDVNTICLRAAVYSWKNTYKLSFINSNDTDLQHHRVHISQAIGWNSFHCVPEKSTERNSALFDVTYFNQDILHANRTVYHR